MQDALKKNKKTTYIKLTLPNTGNKLKVAVWASGTSDQLLLHISSVIHACKHMGLNTHFADPEKAVLHTKLEVELAKTEYVQVRSSKKKRIRAISLKAISWRALTPT